MILVNVTIVGCVGGSECSGQCDIAIVQEYSQQFTEQVGMKTQCMHLALLPLASGTLASGFAFFPLLSPPLYGSLCNDFHLVFWSVPMIAHVSGHECWLGGSFCCFGNTWGCTHS